jgi:hypothetical protein
MRHQGQAHDENSIYAQELCWESPRTINGAQPTPKGLAPASPTAKLGDRAGTSAVGTLVKRCATSVRTVARHAP